MIMGVILQHELLVFSDALAGVLQQLVEDARIVLQEVLGRVELHHVAIGEHHDPVRVQDGVEAVRDRQDGAVLEALPNCVLYKSVASVKLS